MKCFLVALFFVFSLANAQQPAVFVMNAAKIVEVKKNYSRQDKSAVALVDSLVKKAKVLLDMKPVSVMDKTVVPVSGNKHDYMSQAPYFWYDSSKPNGRPYIRRDGEHNPEIKNITDRTYIGDLESASRTLSLAWYITGNEIYAAKAAGLIRHWFIEEATKMNPHLEYAQAIPGINNGRGIGIIETRNLTGIADAIGLLKGSKSWTNADDAAMQQWFKDYLNWMLTSKNGRDEKAAKNNHGTWYYMQVLDFALFTRNKKLAQQLADESKKLLDSQLTAEGNFPLELERTNALGYSTFNLLAWFQVAHLSEKAGGDLWNFKTSKGVSLKNAVDWLLPYSLGEKKWPYKQIGSYRSFEFYPVLMMAAEQYNNSYYESKAGTIRIDRFDPILFFMH